MLTHGRMTGIYLWEFSRLSKLIPLLILTVSKQITFTVITVYFVKLKKDTLFFEGNISRELESNKLWFSTSHLVPFSDPTTVRDLN